MLISLVLTVVFGVLACVSPSPSIFIVMRFCLAAASAGVYLTLYITRECFFFFCFVLTSEGCNMNRESSVLLAAFCEAVVGTDVL